MTRKYIEIDNQINHLKSELVNALNSDLMTYEMTKKIITPGIYLVYNNNKIIYVGKTNREGRTRLTELASDYRSHTLNKKLLRELLSEKLAIDFPPLKKETKHELISGGIISKQNFIELQKKVNQTIRADLKFKFHSVNYKNLITLEHFAIAVLKPAWND